MKDVDEMEEIKKEKIMTTNNSSGRITPITFYRQYETFRVNLDVFSEELSSENVFKKSFLYIVQWVKERIGEEQVADNEQLQKLEKYPEPEKYASFDLEDMQGFKQLDMMDVRMFYLPEEKSWALRINELDNRAEFTSGDKADEDQIHGRSFITEVAIRQNEETVSLAIELKCKEPIYNSRAAMSFRPAFVRRLFLDSQLCLVESGLGKGQAYKKSGDMIDELRSEPHIIDTEKSADSIKNDLINNNSRQMPIVLCPEEILTVTQPMKITINGESAIKDMDYHKIAMDVVGYGHMSVIRKCMYQYVFPEDGNGNKSEWYNKLESGNIIIFSHYDEQPELPNTTFCCSLVNFVDGIDSPSYEGMSSFEIIVDYIHKYKFSKPLINTNPLFYRQLKKRYYENDDKRKVRMEAYDNVCNENEELQETIRGLEEDVSKNKGKSIKFKNIIDAQKKEWLLEKDELKDKIEEGNEIIQEHKKTITELKKSLAQLGRQDMPELDANLQNVFYNSTKMPLILCEKKYHDCAIFQMVQERIICWLQKCILSLDPKTRRYDIVLQTLQYQEFLKAQQMLDNSHFIYFPSDVELYTNEYHDIILDEIFKSIEDDDSDLKGELLEFSKFEYEVQVKQEEFKNSLKNSKGMEDTKRIMTKYGMELLSEKKHLKYSYYGNKKYTFMAPCTPSDSRSLENLAQEVIKLCM